MVNPINVNTQGVGSSYGFNNKSKSSEEAPEEEVAAAKAPAEQKSSVSADDVLSYMAQSAVAVSPKLAVDPSKYVDKASEARIAGFMAGFEDVVAKNLSAISAEFPSMSEDGQMALALAGANKQVQ